MARIQRRAIHFVCQKGEEHLAATLTATLPVPSAEDEFHPAKKTLLCIYSHVGLVQCHACCAPGCIVLVRDGRSLRNDVKMKTVLSVDRWLARRSGFQRNDMNLQSLGLGDLVPTHHHRRPFCIGLMPATLHEVSRSFVGRMAADYAFRYFRKAADTLHKDLTLALSLNASAVRNA